jgi:hypothetical protein
VCVSSLVADIDHFWALPSTLTVRQLRGAKVALDMLARNIGVCRPRPGYLYNRACIAHRRASCPADLEWPEDVREMCKPIPRSEPREYGMMPLPAEDAAMFLTPMWHACDPGQARRERPGRLWEERGVRAGVER